MQKQKLTYQQAGVSIDAGDTLVENIKPLAKATERIGCTGSLGGFGGLFDLTKLNYKNPLLVSGTDGVGTKLKLAIAAQKHTTIGIDLVAMCVNDILVQGAEPLFFLDYFATGKLDTTIATKVIAGITEGCKQAGCALIGGETAEMPGMYKIEDYDLAGFAVGAVEREQLLPKTRELKADDLLIGLPSSGVHSNGFSLVRKIIEQEQINWFDAPPFESEHTRLIDELLTPTTIYVKQVLPLMQAGLIKAAAHITGGGLLENIKRVVPEKLSIELNKTAWKKPPVFEWLSEFVDQDELFKTFNMGIGMVLIINQQNIDHFKNLNSTIIGTIKE